MSFFMSIIIILIILALVALWAMNTFNRFVQLKAMVDEAWSGINVQLKRRYDLIPNLVAVVKQYSIHEKEVLENITKMRSISMNAASITDKASAESGLSGALKTLFAVAENYPDLKANQNFLSLQGDLGKLEDELQLSRRYYNGATRNYNASVGMFPSKLVAQFTGFAAAPYFELDNAAERQAPQIKF